MWDGELADAAARASRYGSRAWRLAEPQPAKRTDTAWRVIHAARDALYRAFVDPAALIAWLPPEGMSGELLDFDPRAGGGYRMRLTYRDAGAQAGKSSADSDVVERFVELVPGLRIVQQAEFELELPGVRGDDDDRVAVDPGARGHAGDRHL